MTHAEDTLRRWQEICWAAAVYDQWAALFGSLIGQPEKAEAICELGLQLVNGTLTDGYAARNRVESMLRGVSVQPCVAAG